MAGNKVYQEKLRDLKNAAVKMAQAQQKLDANTKVEGESLVVRLDHAGRFEEAKDALVKAALNFAGVEAIKEIAEEYKKG